MKWRVYIGPVEIAGLAEGLARGLNELNQSAEAIFCITNPFSYGKASNLLLYRLWQRVGFLRNKTPHSKLLKKILLVLTHRMVGWIVFFRLIFKFDAFIFLYGQTITESSLELWFLKLLHKKIIFIYVGSDSRPPYIDGGRHPGFNDGNLPSAKSLFSEVKKCKEKILLHEKYASYCVNAPGTAQFHEKKFINWFEIGIPKMVPESIINQRNDNKCHVRILHSPSQPMVKGTKAIVSAISNLQKKGYCIELVEIQGVSNATVLQELQRCDFVVDQLYSDSPMAVFAMEAAFFGKPAVVGGYFSKVANYYINENTLPPSLFVMPDAIEEAIERLITDIAFRKKLGSDAELFVSTKWNQSAVAQRYLDLLNDKVSSHWWSDPTKIKYPDGCGMSRFRAGKLISLLIHQYGTNALNVSDKPELEQSLIALGLAETGAI